MAVVKSKVIDETRIEVLLNRLKVVWKRYPYLRLSQLIGNVYPSGVTDPYYMEDEKFIESIEEFYSKAALINI